MTSTAPSVVRAPDGESGLLRSAETALARGPGAGPSWLAGLRREASVWFGAHGFPTQRLEAFRFTPVREALRAPLAFVGTEAPAAAVEGDGVSALSLEAALAKMPDRLEETLGRGAALRDGFGALSAALLADVLVVVASRGARGTVRVAGRVGTASAVAMPRIVVLAERESTLTLVETHVGPELSPLTLATTEVFVGEDASVEHVRIHDGAADARALATLNVSQARNSRYTARVFAFGGALSRLDLAVTLAGAGAECALEGLYLTSGADLVDHHTTVDHASPNATSRQRFKGLVGGSGTAVFDGTVIVRPDASRTEAHQENRNLLLSGDAVVHAKPHLRIDTDDVKCSHGATVGRLDPVQLFYLRSRGMDLETARAVLTVAFAREIVLGVSDEKTRAALDARLSRAFPGGILEGGA
ncbi:MAG TPA: Fe-S cluster assembly protein SufD [Polyangiaceae bacterium]|nr:Fe-S cluster assembly protein SufD [Polyangiaceae bacterium]